MMENKEIDKIFNLIKSKKFDALFLSVSNENLYEFTKLEDNLIYNLTRFSGDTASLLVTEFEAYLYVDGRFTIQAKNEIKNKKIKIKTVNKQSKIIDDLYDKLCIGDRLMIDYKNISIDKVISIKEKLSDKNIKLSNWRNNSYNINTIKIEKIDIKNCSDNLFIIPQKYVTKKPALKIKKLCDLLKDKGFNYYITSSLEEIAYLTNLRKYPKTYNDIILTTSFMIVSQNESYLYLKEDTNESIVKFLNKNNIKVKQYQDFYEDLYKYRNCMYAINAKINNYYIYKCLMIKNKSHFIDSPLLDIMSKKENKEIKGIRFCNVIDGIAITKSIYDIKARIKLGEKLSEYDIKGIVDNYRKIIGKNDFISPSFETIVAYNENSAICHYVPKETQSVIVKKNGLLLIDSGGNYLCGTTDITRTISLYEKEIPKVIKKHYTLVLNSLIKLAIQKFPYGLTGTELDIVARSNLYNEYLDFNHGTGHGIGYISNVHEGPNRIGPGIVKNYKRNVLEPNQVTSDEPGLYFENKYGIRLENDLLTLFDKETVYGDFLKFETLTICPFDRDLIDEDELTEDSIKFLNEYNKFVFKMLYNKLDKNEKKMLIHDTKMFKKGE